MTKKLEDLARESYLQSGDVEARITELEEHADPAEYGSGEDWEDAVEELRELTAFRNEVIVTFGAAKWDNGMSFVHDNEWEKFAEEEAGDLYGKPVVDSGFFDLDKWTDELLTDFTDFELDDFTFWTRS